MMASAGALAILLGAAAFYLYNELENQYSLPHAVYETNDKILSLELKQKDGKQTAILGHDFELKYWRASSKCEPIPGYDSAICAEWERETKLQIDYNEESDKVRCYNIHWNATTKDFVPHDCFQIGDSHWYGGAELFHQRWPIEKQEMAMYQYLSYDTGLYDSPRYGSVLERYWLSSNGVAIFVDDDVPLHVGINQTDICFMAKYEDSWYPNPLSKPPHLSYQVCVADDVKTVHKYMADRYWRKPVSTPDESLFKYPIWSTWAKYKMAVDETKVLEFMQEIIDHNFTGCQIEIDDMYTPTYGDWTFTKDKFPNPKNMTNKIHEIGMRVTSWIMPFANTNSEAFNEGSEKGYFIKDSANRSTLLTKWWQGEGALIDATNPDAMDWFFQGIQRLKDAGVDSFKFDAGETGFLTSHFSSRQPLVNPNHYTTFYAESVHNHTDNFIEVRVGYKSQHLPVLTRMMDKNSDWGYNAGFKTMIPAALHFGIIGYPFVLPDMIGGNAYSDTGGFYGEILDKELFIRWVELNAFLPVMQYSITPWQYDSETVKISKFYTELHTNYVAPKIISLAEQSVESGDPIIRPLWWIDPLDSKTFDIESEFLVGDDLLVAPILDAGKTERDIYLPKGTWKDMLRNKEFVGPKLIQNFRIDLDEIACFERIAP